ncbi:MAG: flavin reductase family protein [Lachnospiraceae bacterium]|nr:flavin reductase family protein [Lachnospiraceae bacterium]
MAKVEWKPGNMLYPLPAVLVTSRNREGKEDVCTVAWAGTVCTNPPMVSISLRPSRLSYEYICETGVFVINVTTEKIVRETDYCGVRSGRNEDKFSRMKLKASPGPHTGCAMLEDSPVCIECKVAEKKELGSHTMFLANVVAVHVDDSYLDEKKKFDFAKTKPIVYSHGEYRGLGRYLGKFGYSVVKKKKKR